jgi:8-oxo-dGTP pyrophosphatase MutT (NUDIX family)
MSQRSTAKASCRVREVSEETGFDVAARIR